MMDITVEEFKKRVETGEKINLLDVREEWEYEEGNLGGLLIPLGQLPERVENIAHWKTAEVVVHCKSGKRSLMAKDFLCSQGFENVRNLEGGYAAATKGS